ncbi:MAG: dTDP-glucose 4,6-dehydratase [Elusimicrobiota bacterium]
MEKILVTGGCGFIGSNFIKYLLKKDKNVRVTNLDKLTYAGNPENLFEVKNNPNYVFVKGDICDKRIVSELSSKNEVIINFAAETHVDRSIMEPEQFIKTDIFGTYTLLESALEFNHKKFIQISTDEVYGSIENGSFREDAPLRPNSPYAASKASADLLILSYRKTYNLPSIIVRPSNNFGPNQYPEKLIPLFVTNALQNIPLPLYGDGKNVRDWLYVMDNCEAIHLILTDAIPGEIYNVGGSNEITNIEITQKILSILGKSENLIKKVKDRPGHDRRYSLDCAKIKSTLGWKPKHTFESALKDTIEWYKNNVSWWEAIKNRQEEFKKFYNQQYKSH